MPTFEAVLRQLKFPRLRRVTRAIDNERSQKLLQLGGDAPAPFWVEQSRSCPEGFYVGQDQFENHHYRSLIEDRNADTGARVCIDPAGWVWSGDAAWTWNLMFWDGQKLWGPSYPQTCQTQWNVERSALKQTWQAHDINITLDTDWVLSGAEPRLRRQILVENTAFERQDICLLLVLVPWGTEQAGFLDRLRIHPPVGLRVGADQVLTWQREPDNALCGSLADGNLAKHLEDWQFRINHVDPQQAAQGMVGWRLSLRSGATEHLEIKQALVSENTARSNAKVLVSVVEETQPLPELQWPLPALDRLWQNNLGLYQKIIRADQPLLDDADQGLAAWVDAMLGQKTRLQQRRAYLQGERPLTPGNLFACSQVCDWQADRSWDKDLVGPSIPVALDRLATLRQTMSKPKWTASDHESSVHSGFWDTAAVAWYAQHGGDTQLKFKAGALLQELRPQLENIFTAPLALKTLVPAVWPLALLSPTDAVLRKTLYAQVYKTGAPVPALLSSVDETLLLHSVLLSDSEVFRARINDMLARPCVGSLPEHWHPLTQYGGAGLAQDLRATLLVLQLLNRSVLSDAGDSLWLFPLAAFLGYTREWVFLGKRVAHRFGSSDIWVHVDRNGELEIDLEQHYLTVPKELKLRVPFTPKRVEVDGKAVTLEGQVLRMGPRVAKIRIRYDLPKDHKLSQHLE